MSSSEQAHVSVRTLASKSSGCISQEDIAHGNPPQTTDHI